MKYNMNFIRPNSMRSGFTLIELLVVIAIIGVLSSVVLASVNTSRERARNAARRTTLTQVRSALELYKTDHGSYPVSGSTGSQVEYMSSCDPNDAYNIGQNLVGGDCLGGLISEGKYYNTVPTDPKPGLSSNEACAPQGFHNAYIYISDGNNYKFIASCSPEGTLSPSDTFFDPQRETSSWMVTNKPGIPVEAQGNTNSEKCWGYTFNHEVEGIVMNSAPACW